MYTPSGHLPVQSWALHPPVHPVWLGALATPDDERYQPAMDLKRRCVVPFENCPTACPVKHCSRVTHCGPQAMAGSTGSRRRSGKLRDVCAHVRYTSRSSTVTVRGSVNGHRRYPVGEGVGSEKK